MLLMVMSYKRLSSNRSQERTNYIACTFQLIMKGLLFSLSLGGEVCRIGSRWVVNPSGGLESKGVLLNLLLYCIMLTF